MATAPQGSPPPKSRGGTLATVTRWLTQRSAAVVKPDDSVQQALRTRDQLENWDTWNADPVSMQFLAGTPRRQIRSRQQVYEVWQDMLADPVVATALRLHVTAALGGDEDTGQMVFIEAKPGKGGKAGADDPLVAEIAGDLQDLFNRLAPTVAFNGVAFGDAYGRLYGARGVGIQDIYIDELVYPPLIQPFERGNTTIGFTAATGQRFQEKLSILQMARLKMPRMLYLPQNRVIEKAIRSALTIDALEDLPPIPALAGGSFLDGAEAAYQRFDASWTGLTGQRVRDSIDETMLSVTQTGMTPLQREKFSNSLRTMFERTNAYIDEVVKKGRAVFGRLVHFIPTSNDKQVVQIGGQPSQGSRSSSLTIDDVMMNARLLGGALGCDITLLGFADQMSGGLGEGGFFRVSAQSAERARAIRTALTAFFEHCIAVHLFLKKGIDVASLPEKPWQVRYFSGISALQTERARTKADNMNSSALMVQTMEGLKNLGLDEPSMVEFMKIEMGLDEALAKRYARAMVKAAEEAKKAEAQANGSGPGGGPDGPVPGSGAEPGEPGGGIASEEG